MFPILLATGRPTNVDVVGTSRLTITEFRSKLGDGAFLLWRKLQYCRAVDGTTHVTARTLSRFRTRDPNGLHVEWEYQTAKQIEKAYRRLRTAGLVVNGKWVKSKRYEAALLTRTIYGGIVEQERVAVPSHVYPRVMMLRQKGGARPGAGRPRKNQRGDIMAANSKGGHRSLTYKERTKSSSLGGFRDFSKKKNLAGAEPAPGSVSISEEHRDGIGTRLGTTASPSIDASRVFADGVPRRPMSTVIYAAKVPRPIELSEDMLDEVKVLYVVQAYAAAMQNYSPRTLEEPAGTRWIGPGGRRFGQNWRERWPAEFDVANNRELVVDDLAFLHKWKFYKTALNAAEALTEKGLRPVEWAAWNFDYGKSIGSRLPYFNMVFSAKRIRSKSGWCRTDQPQLGGRSMPGPKYKELMQRYGQMETALRRSTGPVAEVVERYFPPGYYDQLVAEAQRETKERLADLQTRFRDGEWIWR